MEKTGLELFFEIAEERGNRLEVVFREDGKIEKLIYTLIITSKESSQCESEKPTINEKITSILKLIGTPANIVGYTYLKEAIKMTYFEPKYKKSLTKALYPEIAQKNKTTPVAVEHAIQHATKHIFTKNIKN